MGLLAMWLVPKHPATGWAIGLASEGVWLLYALTTGQYGFIVGSIAYAIVYTRNLNKSLRKISRTTTKKEAHASANSED